MSSNALAELRYRAEPERFDEALLDDGELRPAWAALTGARGVPVLGALADRQRHADRLLDAEGAGHLVHELAIERWAGEPSRPWRLDPVPFVLDAAEFEALAAGATQRMRVLELLLADVYGRQGLVRERIVRAADLYSMTRFRPTPGGAGAVRRWLVQYALDVVRDGSGSWRVVQDLTDAPSGFGFALLDRLVLARLLPDAVRSTTAWPIHAHADALRRALTAAAPRGRRSPRCVVLTAGPGDPNYIEHSYLATQLGYHLVEGADLVMRQGRLWLRALDGLEPIDVADRKIQESSLDSLQLRVSRGGGVPGIVWGARRGGITLANAYGSGVAEEQGISDVLDTVCRSLLGEPLRLAGLAAGAELATTPTFRAERPDELVAAHVVLRLHLVAGPDGIAVMPGAVGRVLAAGDDPRSPTALVAKDVWVVGGGAQQRLPLRVAPPPQIDLRTSVPKRAADALYWLGRAAERAEVAARAVRQISTQLDRDPALPTLADGGWGVGACALLRAAQALPQPGQRTAEELTALPMHEQIAAALRAASNSAAAQIAALVQEAMSVREYLSTDTGRVLGRLARLRSALVGDNPQTDDLDTVLIDLAALAGLATESTVRGPSWRFLDLGRRLERSLAVCGAVEASLGAHVDPLAFQPLAEAVLSANESLVAYRRRYRSDVDLAAVVDLLVHDDTNPRSLAYQLDRLREHVAALAWTDGVDLVQDASLASLAAIDGAVAGGRRLTIDALILAVRAPLLQLSDAIALRWFADPVNPMVVNGQ